MILTALMAHPRELIVQHVVALLLAANTAAGSRVYRTRIDPLKKSALPALAVTALTDPADDRGSSEMEEAHALELKITGWAAQTDTVAADSAVNDLADQVGTTMRADPYLGDLASNVVHKGTAISVAEGDGRSSPTVGVAVLVYTVSYHIALEPT